MEAFESINLREYLVKSMAENEQFECLWVRAEDALKASKAHGLDNLRDVVKSTPFILELRASGFGVSWRVNFIYVYRLVGTPAD